MLFAKSFIPIHFCLQNTKYCVESPMKSTIIRVYLKFYLMRISSRILLFLLAILSVSALGYYAFLLATKTLTEPFV